MVYLNLNISIILSVVNQNTTIKGELSDWMRRKNNYTLPMRSSF